MTLYFASEKSVPSMQYSVLEAICCRGIPLVFLVTYMYAAGVSLSSILMPYYYAAGVSYFSPSLAVTTSIDQRLAVWSVGSRDGTDTADSSGCGQSTTRWTVEQVYSQTHDVADVAALTLYQWG